MIDVMQRTCQREHWPAHKQACKAQSATERNDNFTPESTLNVVVSREESCTDKDAIERMVELRKRAYQGQMDAQYNLGCFYYEGTGVEKNAELAVKWFEQSANQGHMEAQCSLANCYGEGAGVEKNEVLAAKLYERSAKQGYVHAQQNLGLCY